MTGHLSQDIPTSEEKPFQVVLIDMKKAAHGEIRCVEKPLMGSGDLEFVAISYRWGEVDETLIDTGLGYVASITSFALSTLVDLCRVMAHERDLKNMDYVWVDAICVDQVNREGRKATTLYHMTSIYERANYIVAVPDLHLEYLRATSDINREIIMTNYYRGFYIYHLIHGNVAQLEAYDQQFLDECCVPNDPHLRHLLINYTNHFANGFIQCRPDHDLIEDDVFQHLLSTHSPVNHHHHHRHGRNSSNQPTSGMESDQLSMDLDKLTINELHTCNMLETCPLKFYFTDKRAYLAGQVDSLNEFKKSWIPTRSREIRQLMAFLIDLVKDWSTRAWVVSECHIAKRKSNKMKYWFMQLDSLDPHPERFNLDEYLFFEFDFNGDDGHHQDNCLDHLGSHHPHAVYQVFHATMQQQLNQQTFLEKMLKTKASYNADRFHAILPSSEYKHILTNKEQVDSWKITSLTTVKLQLYDWMNTKHKLELFFLSGKNKSAYVLPTFATTTLRWPRHGRYPTTTTTTTTQAYDHNQQYNFDLTRDDAIKLIKHNGSYKLNVKPLGYYRHENYRHIWQDDLEVEDDKEDATVRKLLDLASSNDDDVLDLICIQDFVDNNKYQPPCYVFLLGSFSKNKWIMEYNYYSGGKIANNDEGWHHHSLDKNDYGFDIY